MSIVLTKGGNINLTKDNPGLTKVVVGLGWNVNKYNGAAFDLDASAALLNADGKLVEDHNFVFFNNKSNPNGSVKLSGDNLTGEGEGDDEQIFVDLANVPADVDKIRFAITIYQAKERNQNFGIVEKAYVRVLDGTNNTELVRYDLTEDYSTETTVIAGELYRNGSEWKFKALGQGLQGEITELVASYR